MNTLASFLLSAFETLKMDEAPAENDFSGGAFQSLEVVVVAGRGPGIFLRGARNCVACHHLDPLHSA